MDLFAFLNNLLMVKKTTPAFIPTVVKAIAKIKKVEVAVVAEQIMKNFEDFFGVKLNKAD